MYLDAADEAALLNQGLGAGLRDRGVLAMAYDHKYARCLPVCSVMALPADPRIKH